MDVQFLDFVSLFKSVFDMNTFVLIFCNLFQPVVDKNRQNYQKS